MDDVGTRMYVCSDTDYCGGRLSTDGAAGSGEGSQQHDRASSRVRP